MDADDRIQILRVLQDNCHPLTTKSNALYHIISGQVADAKMNVQDALEIGTDMSEQFSASLPDGFHAPIS